jgi:hypothetical protein
MGVVTDGSTHYQRQVGAGEYGLEHNWTPVFKRGEFFGWTETIRPEKLSVAIKGTPS